MSNLTRVRDENCPADDKPRFLSCLKAYWVSTLFSLKIFVSACYTSNCRSAFLLFKKYIKSHAATFSHFNYH